MASGVRDQLDRLDLGLIEHDHESIFHFRADERATFTGVGDIHLDAIGLAENGGDRVYQADALVGGTKQDGSFELVREIVIGDGEPPKQQVGIEMPELGKCRARVKVVGVEEVRRLTAGLRRVVTELEHALEKGEAHEVGWVVGIVFHLYRQHDASPGWLGTNRGVVQLQHYHFYN